jgi:hypothetical protein
MDYRECAGEAAMLHLPVSDANVDDGDHVKDHGTVIFFDWRQFSLRNQRFRTVIAQKLRSRSFLITAIFPVRSRLFSNWHDKLEI